MYAERWCEEWAGGGWLGECHRDRQGVRRSRPVGYAGIVLPSKTASSFQLPSSCPCTRLSPHKLSSALVSSMDQAELAISRTSQSINQYRFNLPTEVDSVNAHYVWTLGRPDSTHSIRNSRLRVDRPLDCNETTCNSDPHCQEPVRLITRYFVLQ